ncbi:MAG: MBL fold metallo-hydrolase [Patescibacteria group bacterium]
MEITYIGHSCFRIKGKTLSLVVDPYDPKIGYKLPKLSADVVLVTHNHFDHNNVAGVSDYRLLVDGPGEYEVGGVFIYGRSVFHDDKQGAERGRSTFYLITVDGVDILHLGDLGHELSQEDLEKIPSVEVLMIPVGGKYTLDAEMASKVISAVQPSYVIPMHYKTNDSTMQDIDGVDKFLDVMGVENGIKKDMDKLTVNAKKDESEDTEVIVLKPTH